MSKGSILSDLFPLRIRVVNRKRFLIFMSLLMIVLSIPISILTTQISVQGRGERDYDTVYIVEGDTLWDIALRYKHSNIDIRDYIDKIMIENNMKSPLIVQGQTLKIPIE